MLEPNINFRKELIEANKGRFYLMFLSREIDLQLCQRNSTNGSAISLSRASVCITKFLGFSQYPFLSFINSPFKLNTFKPRRVDNIFHIIHQIKGRRAPLWIRRYDLGNIQVHLKLRFGVIS